jgi:hypothetical protein
MFASKVIWASALTALVLSCGGPDRPPENPAQGPATGGRGSDVLPTLPSPTPAPGNEPIPGPGGPDTTPNSDTPQDGSGPTTGPVSWRELRSPLIALGPVVPSALKLDSDRLATGGSGAASGRPGSITGGTSATGGFGALGGGGNAVR